MRHRCFDCGRIYEDIDQWTICPHGPLGFAPSAYDPDTDTIRGFNHPDDVIDVVPENPRWLWPAYWLSALALGVLIGWWVS